MLIEILKSQFLILSDGVRSVKSLSLALVSHFEELHFASEFPTKHVEAYIVHTATLILNHFERCFFSNPNSLAGRL